MFTKGDQINSLFTLSDNLFNSDNVTIWKCSLIENNNENLVIKIFIKDCVKSALKSNEIVEKLKKLDSNSLLKPKYVGIIDGKDFFFITMDFCNNSLYNIIQQRGMNSALGEHTSSNLFSKRESIQLINQIFEGISAMHSSGLVHLDLKPSNIMVADQKGGIVYQLSDFDNIRDVEKTVTRDGLKEDHGISPNYAAPEQFNKNYYAEKCSDIYSAGLTIFQALTGDSIPYEGTEEINEFRLREELVKNKLKQIGIDQPIQDIISKCLSVDKQKRPKASDIYGLTRFYLDEGKWPSGNSNIGKGITTGGRVELPSGNKVKIKKWISGGIAACVLLLSVGFYSFFFAAESEPPLKSANLNSIDYPDCEGEYTKLLKIDWSEGINKMEDENTGLQALQLEGENRPFFCGFKKINKINKKGFAVITHDDGFGIINSKGKILIPIGGIDKDVASDFHSNDKDFSNLIK